MLHKTIGREITVASMLWLTFGATLAQNVTEVPTKYKTSDSKFLTLIVETVYPYKVETYAPGTNIPIVGKALNKQDLPEDTVSALLSSMKAKDWDWNSQLWTPDSLKEMAMKDKQKGTTPQDWLKVWSKEANYQYVYVSRVLYSKFVLIEYEAQSVNGKKVYRDSIAMEQINGKWYLTQKLAADPILTHWNNPSGRVQAAPNNLFVN